MPDPVSSTVQISEEKEVNKGDEQASEVEHMDEITEVADKQNSMGASHMAETVGVEPLPQRGKDKGLTTNLSEMSYPESTEAVLSTTTTNASDPAMPIDTTGESFKKRKQDDKKMEEGKADNQMTSLFEEHRITVQETCAPSDHGDGITQSKDFSEQGSLDCLDVIPSATDEIVQALQPVRTEDDLNEKKDDGEMQKEKKDGNVPWPLLKREIPYTTAIQGAHGPTDPGEGMMQINVPLAEQHGDVAVVDFSAKDLLSFAWQIAKGMVSAVITVHVSRAMKGFYQRNFCDWS